MLTAIFLHDSMRRRDDWGSRGRCASCGCRCGYVGRSEELIEDGSTHQQPPSHTDDWDFAATSALVGSRPPDTDFSCCGFEGHGLLLWDRGRCGHCFAFVDSRAEIRILG